MSVQLFIPTLTPSSSSPAQLLCKNHHRGDAEEDRHLFQTADSVRRGDHVRLQVPDRGGEDCVSVWSGAVQGNVELRGL